jgi:hypothetical protein
MLLTDGGSDCSMASKKSGSIEFMDLRGIAHDCKDGKHKALLIDSKGNMYETMPASSRAVQDFIDEKSEKLDIPSYFGDECRAYPSLRKRMIGNPRRGGDVIKDITKKVPR